MAAKKPAPAKKPTKPADETKVSKPVSKKPTVAGKAASANAKSAKAGSNKANAAVPKTGAGITARPPKTATVTNAKIFDQLKDKLEEAANVKPKTERIPAPWDPDEEEHFPLPGEVEKANAPDLLWRPDNRISLKADAPAPGKTRFSVRQEAVQPQRSAPANKPPMFHYKRK